MIYCSNWTFVISPDTHADKYLHVINPKAKQTVLKLLDEDKLIDAWRVYLEQEKCFRWSRRTFVRKQARLHFFLACETLFPYVTDASITTGFKSDHRGIFLNKKNQ